MPRPFVVVSESISIVADCGHSFFEMYKFIGAPRDLAYLPFVGAHGMARLTSTKKRIKRVLCENMFDVRDKQFLMLLFVMNAEHENRLNFIQQSFIGA